MAGIRASAKQAATEVLKGDFDQGPTTLLGQVTAVGVGLIPVVGQVADVRDAVAAVKRVFESRKSGGAWAGLGMAAVAFLAGVGDALKAEYKAQKLL